MESAKPKIGDVIEVTTPKGLAYAQYTHSEPLCGDLIRILPGIYRERPQNIKKIVEQPELYYTFFFLHDALSENLTRVVANEEIPERSRAFPLFKAGIKNPATGRVDMWWLWDGKKEWRIGKLTPEQRHLPLREIWNDILLAQRIADGWMPEKEE